MKSALLRPDDSPREDTDQAIHVRPFNSDQNYEHDSEDDYETDPSKFSEHNNDNDNDYSDDDDDDDDDDHQNEHDEEAGDWMNQFKHVFQDWKYIAAKFTVILT